MYVLDYHRAILLPPVNANPTPKANALHLFCSGLKVLGCVKL